MSPKRVERLEKTLARVAREQALDQERLRRWVSFLALCGVLERAAADGVLDGYYLKGGVAMDIGLDGERSNRMKSLERALALGFDAFTFRLKAQTRNMDMADTIRVPVAVQYRSRAWQTIDVDLGPAGAGSVELVRPAIHGLAELGLPMISPIRCLSLADQLAQKLHACTGPHSEGRARDILDILLIDLLGKLDYARVRKTAVRLFSERATHAFPPEISIPPEWHVQFRAMAVELGYPVTDPAAIEDRFRKLLASITQAGG